MLEDFLGFLKVSLLRHNNMGILKQYENIHNWYSLAEILNSEKNL